MPEWGFFCYPELNVSISNRKIAEAVYEAIK
jgi:hypothetical protein